MRTSLCLSLMSYGGSYDFFRPFDKEIVSSECKKLNGRIYVNLKPRTYDCRVINQVDRRTAMTRVSIDQLNKHFPADQIFKTMIPVNAAFQRAENERKTIIRYDPTTLGAKAYRALAKELLEIFSLDSNEEP